VKEHCPVVEFGLVGKTMHAETLVIMLKEPHPGRVKTRLGRGIGLVPAAWWFRHQVRRLLREVEDPRWDVVLAVSPDAEGLTSRVWPAHFVRVAQGSGDLGDRMGHGGYWLIGLRHVPAGAFAGVRWSSAHALADTQRSLGRMRVAHVDMLRDVDEVGDL